MGETVIHPESFVWESAERDITGKLKIIRTLGGRRRVSEGEILCMQGEARKTGKLVGYARVSSESQKDRSRY